MTENGGTDTTVFLTVAQEVDGNVIDLPFPVCSLVVAEIDYGRLGWVGLPTLAEDCLPEILNNGTSGWLRDLVGRGSWSWHSLLGRKSLGAAPRELLRATGTRKLVDRMIPAGASARVSRELTRLAASGARRRLLVVPAKGGSRAVDRALSGLARHAGIVLGGGVPGG